MILAEIQFVETQSEEKISIFTVEEDVINTIDRVSPSCWVPEELGHLDATLVQELNNPWHLRVENRCFEQPQTLCLLDRKVISGKSF